MGNKGLTLIELVIAIFVIAVGTTGTFSVLQKVVVSSSLSSSRLVAAYLAQEGIEIIRNIRDTSWVKGETWDNNISAEISYYLDYRSLEFPDSTYCAGEALSFDEGLGFYTCESPTGKIKREVTVTKPRADKMEITVRVEWEEAGKTQEISVQENLYDWYSSP